MENTDTDAESGQSTDEAEKTKDAEHAHQNQEQSIPKWRLDQVLGEVRQLREQNENLTQQKEQTANKPHEFTAVELDQHIEEGRITQTQASEQLIKQAQARTDAEIDRRVDDRASQLMRGSTLQAEMNKYLEKVPTLSDADSETFARVATEYNYLTQNLGMAPDTPETRLAAVRGVLGPVETLGEIQKSKASFETQEETGSLGGSELHNDGKDLTWTDLSPGQRTYYDQMIQAKQYKDRAEVLSLENEHGISRLRMRHGAKR